MMPAWRSGLRTLSGDLAGGLNGALLSLPNSIGYGLIVFAPLGAAASAEALLPALLAAIIGGAVVALFGSTRGLAVGGSSSLSLLLAGVVAVATAGMQGPEAVAAALAAVLVCTLLAGLLLAAFAWAGAGGAAPLMPYSVLAGIVNGTALLMILSLARHALGMADGAWHPGAPLVAAATLALVLMRLPRWLSAVPAALLAVVAGTALHHALVMLGGPDWLGPLLGTLPPPEAWAEVWTFEPEDLTGQNPGRVATQILPVAASIAVLATLETLSSVSALRDATGQASDPKRDLMATALANVLSALAGGIALSGSVGTSLAVLRSGGTTRFATLLRSLLMLAGALLLAQVIGQVPMAAMAGLVIGGAVRLFDLEPFRPLRRVARAGARHRGDVVGSAVVVVAVAGIAVAWSLMMAVGVGLLLALAVFATAMARDVVRRSYAGPVGRSRVRRSATDTDILAAEARRVVVVEVEGAIFFGSAEQIARRIATAREEGADYVILDLRRVSRIDHSGARRLLRSCERFWSEGLSLSLAYIRPGLAVWDYLNELGMLRGLREAHVFASLDAAIEDAEVALLARFGSGGETSLEAEPALVGLGISPAAARLLLPLTEQQDFAAGDFVIRAGESARSVFLLLQGQLDVTIALQWGALRTRLATLTAGTLVGEMALLSGAPRSADVLARGPARCLRLEVEAVERLRRDQPDAAYELLAGIALQMQHNLRLANMTINSLEE